MQELPRLVAAAAATAAAAAAAAGGIHALLELAAGACQCLLCSVPPQDRV